MKMKIRPRATISLIVGGLMLFGILGTILGNGDDAKKPLAVGDAIPDDLFKAVAEVLAWVMRQERRRGRKKATPS